ncbi:MAG TPA: serine/threonine-protein kinase [Kofleriaceae bacterium]|nr:serine/threonine-protein kinase [Kofleriaceae bacterium]
MQDDDTLESSDPKPAVVAAPRGRVGKYEILRELGSGGMGVVWAAQDPDLGREVAIKLLRAERASPEQRTRLLREARAMARLKHPNVLTVYEVGTADGRDFIAMELVDGQNLDDWLRGKPSQREVWDALLASGHGLVAAHAAGVVHRDFKPHNVLRSHDGRVLVTDFGLARGAIELEDTQKPSAPDSVLEVQLTATGALLGTPAYMAPEQFDGETDTRADQFAFCVTAWEALSGTRPYEGATIEELRDAACSGTPSRTAKLPPGVRAVLARGLAPDPASRWPDMAALLAALERTRHRGSRRLAVIAPLVLLLGALVAFVALRGHATTEAPCVPEQAFGSAWTPAIRTGVLATHADLASIAPRLDAYRAQWLDGYGRACRASAAERSTALACYGELRDELALHVELLQRHTRSIVGDKDLVDLLAAGDTCDKLHISRPPFPTDARRDQILAFLARAYGIVGKTDGKLADFEQLRTEAKALRWPPLEARIEEMIATASAGIADISIAGPAYRHAADLAHAAQDPVTEAHARLGILNVAADSFSDDVQPSGAFESELRDAEVAVHAAGDQPVLTALLDDVRARHAAYADGDLTKAIDLEIGALRPLVLQGHVFAASDATATLADLLGLRSRPGDLEKAKTQLDAASTMVSGSPWPGHAVFLRQARYWNAWLRGDIAAAHRALDMMPADDVAGATPLGGRVVDEQGHPVAGARVAIWRGEMYGDRDRVFTDSPRAVTSSAADGSFHTAACDGCGIIAELGDHRSAPALVKPGIELVVGPTRALTGTVDAGGEPVAGIEVYARVELAPSVAWYDSIAPARDGTFTIAGIPAATHVQLGAIGSHWPHDRCRRVVADGTTIHWPIGDTVDVITTEGDTAVWLLRGNVAPRSLGDLMDRALAPDACKTISDHVGWANSTASGLIAYHAGASHAVFHDVAPGPVVACIVNGPRPICKQATAGAHGAAPVRDGRHWPSGTAVLF